MRIHPREQMVNQADNRIALLVLEGLDEYPDLTDGEYVRVVTSAFNTVLSVWAKYKIRHERHGDHDKEGGLE